ncbi:uncharacterized protein LOC122798364 isoform X2 [Protopterus annectens]|uniref:uncharacterized protein LOC122798364 isoform X2 n=1 Tax=Protopterus annectens TaxID=7888 RepID=UPI001CFB48F9|nr:uncharacterized protein LOC122798364 isoform X2 [Protopterus annectens]
MPSEGGKEKGHVKEKRGQSSLQVTSAAPSTDSAIKNTLGITPSKQQAETEMLPSGGKGPAQKKRRMSSFQGAWKMLFDWVMESTHGPKYAFCKVCKSNFTITHGGRNDLQRHMDRDKHKMNSKHAASERKEIGVVTTQAQQTSWALIMAKSEVAFVSLLAEHNLPFTLGDQLLKYIKKYCTDLEVVMKISCGATKAICIAQDVSGPECEEDVATVCRKQPYCIYLDQSTDMKENKLLVILVGYFDQVSGQVVVRFLDMPICATGTGEAIYNCLIETLQRFNISASNMAAYSSDYSEVMVDELDSVLSRLKQLNPDLFSVGSLCHIADLCIKSGVKQMALPVEELIADIHCHFSSNTPQQQKLKEFALFVVTEPPPIIHCARTPWLSLSKIIKRMLDLWPVLLSYFWSFELRSKKVNLITQRLNSHDIKLVFLFLKDAVEPLLTFSAQLQARDIQFISLYSDIIKLVQVYASRLLKPAAAKEFVETVCLNSSCLLKDDNNIMQQIHVGADVATYLNENGNDIAGTAVEHTFYKKVKAFYVAVLLEMKKNLPFGDSLLQNIGSFLDPSLKLQLEITVVENIGTHFGICKSRVDWSQLIDEFAMYQITDFKWPQHQHNNNFETDMCFLKYWSAVLQSPVMEEMPVLKRLILTLLCLPHLNNEPQRAFSVVQNIKTELRPSLNVKTLNSLLAMKMNKDNDCCSMEQT